MQIIRYKSSSGTIALGLLHNGQFIGHFQPDVELHHLLRRSADELRTLIEKSTQLGRTTHAVSSLLAPIDGDTEVWAAGVTYKRSLRGTQRGERHTGYLRQGLYRTAARTLLQG